MFRKSLALLFLPLAFAACSEDVNGLNDTGNNNNDPDGGVIDPKDGGTMDPRDSGTQMVSGESEKANLRFKEVLRLTNDFAQATALPPEEVCNELGSYDCRSVHNIALGGVEPYELGLFEPTPGATITTPIAVERLAVHACERRVNTDLDSANAVIFKNMISGSLAIDDPIVAEAIDSLYKHALQRPAKTSEVDHLKQLYRDIDALGVENPARQWAIASCVAVLTSVETLFY